MSVGKKEYMINELKDYFFMKDEIAKAQRTYQRRMRKIKDKIDELDRRLNTGDLSAAPIAPEHNAIQIEKPLSLLIRQDALKAELEEIQVYADQDHDAFKNRVAKVEYCLAQLKPYERDFITDNYIRGIPLIKLLDTYYVALSTSYRERDKIMDKIVEAAYQFENEKVSHE